MTTKLARQHRRVAIACVLFLGGMFGLSYASVPFYTWFCRVTGFGGTPQIAGAPAKEILDRAITVRFDSNLSSELPWRFEPKQREIRVKLGQLVKAVYEVENLSAQETTGMATYNVAPELAGSYFNKLECFCFTGQTLKPKEKREMAVSFFVAPDLVKDKGTAKLDSITLSYTFYPQKPQGRLARR